MVDDEPINPDFDPDETLSQSDPALNADQLRK
jgi:hypothetical protein